MLVYQFGSFWGLLSLYFIYSSKDRIDFLDINKQLIIVLFSCLGIFLFSKINYIIICNCNELFFLNLFNYLIALLFILISYKLEDILEDKDEFFYNRTIIVFYTLGFIWFITPIYMLIF